LDNKTTREIFVLAAFAKAAVFQW